ncbi:BMP family ABC transporter substrate-binding protein [Actinoalloteichus sp. AHMU CJ021]|uniref:Ribose transport system substrate-binding protein n=1 Tax=Actinoalloteichus caeruleus DSM 43889 TaxID=1120930 RepID=A0ABT1JER4_ACTCY|nr:ABC transporter substrate-binding protein [Actinoalloteichus caeruleus]AUS80847.1 BMP family ABC transporter substrate-binding protein [Actinoalloteichus sp. AHMU CJ021]MCP2330266.1 ribose transport system substrate-binding protein [Actinoalloteichus caeruleus DSM 43889]
MRGIRPLAVLGALAVALTGCGPGWGHDPDLPHIAIVSKGFQHQFWQAVKRGAEEEAERRGAGVTFMGPPTEQDVEAQLNMLTNAIARQPDAIGLAALDSRATEPLLRQAEEAGIPVIAFDSGVDSEIPRTTVATDNRAAAALAAEHLAGLLGGTGTVGLVVHDQTSGSGVDRRDGFLDWMRANAPGITVLDPQYGGGDQLVSADITKAVLAANPDLDGLYASNEGSAVGVLRGVAESGHEDLVVVGFDSGRAQLDAVRDGTLAGAVTQDPIDMGRRLVLAGLAAMDGEELPATVDTGFHWYDARTVDDPALAGVLYQ